MKHKSTICFQDLCFIIFNKIKTKRIGEERFLQKIVWRIQNNSNQTNTLADSHVESLNCMNFNMRKFN